MPCTITGCERTRHKGHRYCSMHAERNRRTGSPGGPQPRRAPNLAGSVISSGYVVITGSTHPLAGAQGKVLAHRVVLYDLIGPGSHPCHWCGATVTWRRGRVRVGSLVVDHLNEVKTDNRPENLVPSCNPCNTTRRSR